MRFRDPGGNAQNVASLLGKSAVEVKPEGKNLAQDGSDATADVIVVLGKSDTAPAGG